MTTTTIIINDDAVDDKNDGNDVSRRGRWSI